MRTKLQRGHRSDADSLHTKKRGSVTRATPWCPPHTPRHIARLMSSHTLLGDCGKVGVLVAGDPAGTAAAAEIWWTFAAVSESVASSGCGTSITRALPREAEVPMVVMNGGGGGGKRWKRAAAAAAAAATPA